MDSSSLLSGSTPWDELRIILTEHCHSEPQRERALLLLDAMQQDSRTAGDLTPGGGASSQGFAVRPNGDITGPGHTSAFGDDGLGSNGALWGSAMGAVGPLAAAWGKGVVVGDIQLGAGMGPWGGDGLGAGVGTGWGFPGGSRVASDGVGSGSIVIDDESAVLTGLALDGPPGQAWATNPVPSFELDPTPVQDSRMGSFYMPPAGASAPVRSPILGPVGKLSPSLLPSQGQALLKALPVQKALPAPAPQGNAAAKFSSVVGGTASGRPQVLRSVFCCAANVFTVRGRT